MIMAQAPLTTSRMFTAKWTERDEAVLVELLRRKIAEIKWDMRECDSPYARAKLKSKREEYKHLLRKVESGNYDSNILANELRTHAEFNQIARDKREKALGKYVDAYSDVNFDFENYFGKTRYFGAGLPIVMMILTILLIVVLLITAILPAETINSMEESLVMDSRVTFTSIAYFKLTPNENDFSVPNDGNWPKGTYEYPENALPQGERYYDEDGNMPDKVWLCADLGMNSIDITVFDVIKALFRAPVFSDQRVDVIENLDSMQGYSWYYLRYMRDRADEITIEKGEDGQYDGVAIVKHVATYGTIVFLVAMLICCVIELLMNIGRLFSYTSRRVHVLPFLILLFGALTLLCPAFLEIQDLTADAVSTALSNYFTFYWQDFTYGESMITFNLFFAILLVIPLLIAFMPLFFRNRAAKTIAYVPKGNRAHTYAGDTAPTKAGQPGQRRVKGKGKVAKAGSRSGYSPKYPAR